MDPQQKPQIGSVCISDKLEVHYVKNVHDPYSKDIITGVYEGGLKIWQCTMDMAKFFVRNPEIVQGKTILEIGCGHGILGITAMKLGGESVYFHDYNQHVIQNATIPNSKINSTHKCEFAYGDWDAMADDRKYDVILGSQVTYREQNYAKIIRVLKRHLKPTGQCILANKQYYFGVGGCLQDFLELAEEQGFVHKLEQRIQPAKGGNKKAIVSIKYTQQ